MMKHDAVLEESAAQLLDDYRAGSPFFLSSPHRTILAEGAFATVPSQGGPDELTTLPRRVAALLAHVKPSKYCDPVVVGAVPFDHTTPAQLVVPTRIRWAGPLQFHSDVQATPPLVTACEIREVPEPEEYIRGVEQGLARLQAGEFDKVVLSRSLHLTSPEAIDIRQLLRNLARHNADGYTFAVDLPQFGSSVASPVSGRRTLIGASPELLVSRAGLQVTANPLAGSRPRSEDPAEDQRRAAELLASAKDRHEHAVVVEAVAAALRPYCRELEVPAEPSLVHTATMWHLSTKIVGELSDSATSALELAAALHPTPAVCGTPTRLARTAIREIEPFDRGFFTGMIGWVDASGDGEWVVAIRCAEADEHSLRLFAGAGIVVGSKPEEELAETSAKFRTMLRAMGLDRELTDMHVRRG
ncbi:isochorismate synthase DhbC [Polycladomyces sp. WAk]|uniref:isochorismate synthase n=1 Tax=Polycladomyces zharkentensis TaxID=2807616 RepID=A0ABS2WN88_9BACL|nr:isochorismate synthase DhbC [Polycladomyces sp. WAk]MBN2911028.1 isochorismate synthase DhbC [Polycladomyces sp. WAk]